ncbi:ABC transporter permease [Paenibacillus sp. FA6]|uniref:ABC transporter permease n=1 Tax=Paenibacillus sp. FA6 TaxID=3413029 RepID=UPI003F66033B
MLREVIQEVRCKLTPMFLFLWIFTTVALISVAVYRSQGYQLRDSQDYFTFTLNGVLPITFPIIAVLVYATSFSGEVSNRYLTYTRMRRPIMETLYIKLTANIVLTCLFFFMLIFIPFLFAYYIEPHLGIAKYDPEGFGLTKDNIAADTYTRHTFTQLLQYGTFTYSILYSLWVGMNAALYSAISLVLVLLIRNRFLALTLPFIIYLIGSFTLSAWGIEDYRPNYVIFPFDRVQNPIWTAFVPFLVLTVVLVGLIIYVKRNSSKVDSIT